MGKAAWPRSVTKRINRETERGNHHGICQGSRSSLVAPPKPAAPAAPGKAPPKAAVAPPRPAVAAAPPAPPRPPMAPPKAAPPAPPKPAVAQAAPPAPKTNGIAGHAKAAAPAPAKAAPPAPAAKAAAEGVSKTDFEAYKKEVSAQQEATIEALEAQNSRIRRLELTLGGYGDHVDTDADGNIVLLFDQADEETLRDWAHQFNACDFNADPEAIREHLRGMESKKGFAGWIIQQELPRPGGEAVGAAPEEAAEEVQITEEDIAKMNGTQLAELADQYGLDRTDKPTPKVLRNRILEALTAPEAEAEAAAVEETPGDAPELAEGTELIVTHPSEGTTHAATFVGYDDDGDFVVECSDLGGQVAVGADFVQMAG